MSKDTDISSKPMTTPATRSLLDPLFVDGCEQLETFELLFELVCQLLPAPCTSLLKAILILIVTAESNNHLFAKVLKALQDAVTNHNLAAQSTPQVPEVTPSSVNAKSSIRQLPVHSFQVSQSRPKAEDSMLKPDPSDVFTTRELLRSFTFSGEDGEIRQTDSVCECGCWSAALWQESWVFWHREGFTWQKYDHTISLSVPGLRQ